MVTKRRGVLATALGACLTLVATMPLAPLATAQQPGSSSPTTVPATSNGPVRAQYLVHGTSTPQLRTEVANSGVDVLGFDGEALTFIGTESDADTLRAKGFKVEFRSVVDDGSPGDVGINGFPAGYTGYHDFPETTAEVQKAAANYPALATLSSIGKSFQNRDLWLIKISDNVATDEAEPEVLFNCNQHAREHLTVEMCLRIINRLTSEYATNPTIKNFVDTREIYVVPMVNPDGVEYDIATGSFRSWRKNRQGAGTDLNRNFGYNWGCCGGSSGSTGSETYRGPSAFSAPETQRIRDFVNSRVIGGKQQITTNIDFHTYSQLVLWPFGFTYNDTAPGLDADQARTFQTLGRQMAATNSYTPQQSSDLYITDGTIIDWMWGQHKIWSYTFEMYPSGAGGGGFYPRDTVIARETARNDKAVELFLSYADCVPRVIGKTC